MAKQMVNVLLKLALLILVAISCGKKQPGSRNSIRLYAVDTTVVRVGDKLTVTGTGFDKSTSVSINGRAVDVIDRTAEKITILVQPGISSGQLNVSSGEGRSVAYPKSITVLRFGEPFIDKVYFKQVLVSVDIEVNEGDTLIVKGSGFSNKLESVSVSVAGKRCLIVNTTDSVITLVLPNTGSGNLIISKEDLSSQPFSIKITKVNRNPLEDGRVYFSYAFDPAPVNAASINPLFLTPTTVNPISKNLVRKLLKGSSDESNLGASVLATLPSVPTDTIETISKNYPFYGYRFQSADDQDFYCFRALKISTSLSLSSLSFIRFENDFSIQTYNTKFTEFINFKQGIGGPLIDGRLLYEVAAYSRGGGNGPFLVQNIADYVLIERGKISILNGSSYSFPTLYPSDAVSGPEHGDSVIVISKYIDQAKRKTRIYLFSSTTGNLKVLYDEVNWGPDAVDLKKGAGYVDQNIAWLWAGSHLYYISQRRSPTSSQLLRLNADGSSKAPVLIYNRIESEDLPRAVQMGMFIRKSEAKR